MLGILIGIAAVILTVGLGQGAQDEVSATRSAALGSNLLIVSPGQHDRTTASAAASARRTTLTMADAAALASAVVAPDIEAVAAGHRRARSR